MAEIVNLTLPEWAWMHGGDHELGGDPLRGREVVLHVRSATVVEFFLTDNFVPGPDTKYHIFSYNNTFGFNERHTVALHYSAACDDDETLHQILVEAAKWYCGFMDFEDSVIIENEIGYDDGEGDY